MSTADESDNWRRKKQPLTEDHSNFWDSSPRSFSNHSNRKSSNYDSPRPEKQQTNRNGRGRQSGFFAEDIIPSHPRFEEQKKARNAPAEGATSDWINFSKKNAENLPVITSTKEEEWDNDWDRKPIPERVKENPRSSNRRLFTRHEHNQHDIPPSHHAGKYLHPDDRPKNDKKWLFNAYISPQSVEDGLREGTLLQGEMRISKNRQDAYVKCDDLDYDIYIGGHKDRNRALQNDLVAVRLLDVEIVWEQRKEREAEMAEKRRLLNKSDTVEGLEDDESAFEDDEEEDEENKPKYCGEVVAIIQRPENTTYSGVVILPKFKDNTDESTVDNEKSKGQHQRQLPRLVWFKPIDKRVPLIALYGLDKPNDIMEREEYYKTHLFSAEVRRWLITDNNPAGRILNEIGPVGSLAAEKVAVITDNSIIDAEFSNVALQGLPELPWSIPAVEYKERLDLRNESVFSIDPLTAKDLDDALHIRPLDDGFFEVGVHIADVTYFLKNGTPLDTEASERGTSTYLADRVIPMLPSVLCEQLCSLNPGVDRLAFSVLWIMDKTGEIKKTWYGRTIIRSRAKLAYEHAQEVIEGRDLPADVLLYGDQNPEYLSSDIRLLYDMSIHMGQRRKDSGSLSLHSVKLTFELDSEGVPISFGQAESKEANKLIEEFMLCANISVAEKIKSAYPQEALLRRHEKPIERRLNAFLNLTEVLGLDFDGSSAGTLQTSFNNVDNPDVKSILLILCIRAMQRAKYFCAGALSDKKQIHYALNEPVYTHFTSPIRRYPDVVVHRMLQATLKKKPCDYSRQRVQKIAHSCNIKKQGAKSAQDSDTKLYLATYLNNQEQTNGPIYKKGVIIMTGKRAFEVYIPEYGIESRIYMHSLPVKKFSFDKYTLQLTISWKKDIPVTMHNEEKLYAEMRSREEESSDDEDENKEGDENKEDGENKKDGENKEDEYDDDMEKHLADRVEYLKLSNEHKKIESATELIPPVVIDESEFTQRIQMFSLIDVRLQVNMEVSPPYINVYPLNPFAEKET